MIKNYKKQNVYEKSMKLFIEFCKDMKITTKKNLSNFSFEEIPSEYRYKYGASDEIRASDDPDNTKIMNAIYIILWGEIFNIKDKKDVGSWSDSENKEGSQTSYRGDTMNSFCSMFGSDATGWNRVKHVLGVEVDNNWNEIRKFRKLYHTLGNFLLIPNRKNVNRVKGASGILTDSFELFLSNAYMYYSEKENEINESIMSGYRKVFGENKEYKNTYNGNFLFKLNLFYLHEYFDGEGKPTDSLIDYNSLCFRKAPDTYSKEEKKQYKEAIKKYIAVCNPRIESRSNNLAEELFARMESYSAMKFCKTDFRTL